MFKLSESLSSKKEKKDCLKELEKQLEDKKETLICFKNKLKEEFNKYRSLSTIDWISKLYGIETDIKLRFELNDEVMIKSHKKKFLCLSHNKHNLKYSQELKYFIKEELTKDTDIKGKIIDSSYDNTIFLIRFNNNNYHQYWIHQDDIEKVDYKKVSGGSYKIRNIGIRYKSSKRKHSLKKNNNKYLGDFKLSKTVNLSFPLILNFHNGGEGKPLEILPTIYERKKYNLPFINVTDLENNYKFLIYMFIQTSKLLSKNSLVKLIYFSQINLIRKFISTFSQIIRSITQLQSDKDGEKYRKEFFLLTTPLCIGTEFLISQRITNRLNEQIRKFTNYIGIDLLTVISDYILNIIKTMSDMIITVCQIRGKMIKK